MKVRTLFLLIVLVVISAFAALNWSAFMAPTTLSLGVAVVQAPLALSNGSNSYRTAATTFRTSAAVQRHVRAVIE